MLNSGERRRQRETIKRGFRGVDDQSRGQQTVSEDGMNAPRRPAFATDAPKVLNDELDEVFRRGTRIQTAITNGGIREKGGVPSGVLTHSYDSFNTGYRARFGEHQPERTTGRVALERSFLQCAPDPVDPPCSENRKRCGSDCNDHACGKHL
jgi:hypothetical protein